MERHTNAGHRNTRVIFWLISLLVLVASPSLAQAAITCGECHGGGGTAVKDDPAGTRSVGTVGTSNSGGQFKGSHGTHLSATAPATECAVCHGAPAATYTSNHATLNQRKIQMAGNIDGYTGLAGAARYNKPLFWNMTSAPVMQTCSNVSCHFERTSDTWGNAAYTTADTTTCAKCHDVMLTTGAHGKHIAAYGGGLNSCNQCHTDYTTLGGKMKFQHATSAGRPIMLKANMVYTGSNNRYLPAQVATRVVGSCSNLTCHSSGVVVNPVSWSATSTGCNFCHPLANLSGAHIKHTGSVPLASTTRSYANYTANFSAGADGGTVQYGFGCTTCHPTVGHMNGTIEVTFAADAAAGSMRAKIASSAATYSLTPSLLGNKTCANLYCHSSGIGTVANTTVSWTSNFAGDRCASCHGNLPPTGAHVAHKVGIHYDNIFNGVSGFLGYSSTGNVAHGVATQATTISCNICHANTVNTAFNKNATTCTSCHSSDSGVARVDATNGFQFHVNGKVDVAFKDVQVRSKAQIRDTSFSVYSGIWKRNGGYKVNQNSYDISKVSLNTSVFTPAAPGQGSCANVVCHNQRSGQSVTWNVTLTCESCHSQL